MSSKLMSAIKIPIQSNTKSMLENFPLHPSFNTHFKKSRSFMTSSGSFRSKTRAAINDKYAIIQKQNTESFYDLLGVRKNGSLSEIKTAYKQLARKYHPDVSPPGQAEEYTRRFIRVQEAYETLSDPQARALYDRDMSIQLQYDQRWGDWRYQLMELEWRSSMNKNNSRGNNMSRGARIRNSQRGRAT